MMNKPDVSIVIACYNEESLLSESVDRIAATMDASEYSYELIFIDDASRDRTPEIIKEICDSRANCRCVFHDKNVGRGGTVTEGLRMARGKVAGFLDIDLEIGPEYIESLTNAIERGQYEVGTISRVYEHSWHPKSVLRLIFSKGYQKLVQTTLGLPFTDTEAGYKFFDRARVQPVLDRCRNHGWFWDTEVMALSYRKGLRILELPGHFVRRHDKKSSVRLFRDTIAYLKALRQFRSSETATFDAGVPIGGGATLAVDTGFLGGRISRAVTGIREVLMAPLTLLYPATGSTHPMFLRVAVVDKKRTDSITDFVSSWTQKKWRDLGREIGSIGSRTLKQVQSRILLLAALTVLLVVAFLSYHTLIIAYQDYRPVEKVMAIGLLICEIYFAINGIGYILWISRSRKYETSYDHYFSEGSSSSVACLLPVCDEPIETIRETIASVKAMRYKNKQIYVLDDSTKDENIKNVRELAKTFGVNLIRRKDRTHYKAGNINNALKQIEADYIAVFDADQRPALDFLRDIVPLLDKDPKVALVQTPQDYENSNSLIAHASAFQNALFYEYIAESKDVNGSMFCCGTNFVLRMEALKEVGGFDTATLTEDFATTMKLHLRGWKTRFHDKLYVLGLGPETLGEYLKQYSRWATGTLQVLKSAIRQFVTNPRSLSPRQWFEYWLSCSYYLSGLVNFYLLLLPAAYMIFGINLIRGNPLGYLLLFLLVFISFWGFLLITSVKRGYPAGQLVTVCARLETCKFFVYTQAFFSAFLGLKQSFKVTSKSGSRQLAWSYLAVPLAMLTLNAVSALIGMYRLGIGFHPYLAVNTFWSAYNVWQLSAIIQYNSGSESESPVFFISPGTVDGGTSLAVSAGSEK